MSKQRHLALVWILAAAGCPGNPGLVDGGAPDRATAPLLHAEALVDGSGGTLRLEDGASLEVPAGALSTATLVTMDRVEEAHYRFGPDGTTFARPVMLSLPTPAGLGDRAAIFFSRPGSLDELPTHHDAAADHSIAYVLHFSEAFVREASLLAQYGTQTIALTMGRAEAFGCVVLDDGSLRCFGSDSSGLRGASSVAPLGGTNLLDLGDSVATVAASTSNVACALTLGGALHCWGQNSGFEPFPDDVCDDDVTARPTRLLEGVRDVALGHEHGCVAFRDTGEVACFGSNLQGEAGIGAGPSQAFPCGGALQRVAGVDDVVQVVASGRTSCARQRDGTAYCWGSVTDLWPATDLQTCMRAEPLPCQATPRLVDGVQAIHVSIGADGICFVLNGGDVRCAKSTVWTDLPASNVSYLSSASGTTCAVVRAGEIECWGDGAAGELGDGAFADSADPVPVLGISDALQVAVGSHFTGATSVCATTRGRGLFCWGNGLRGGLGYDRIGQRAGTPVGLTW